VRCYQQCLAVFRQAVPAMPHQSEPSDVHRADAAEGTLRWWMQRDHPHR
jgi:hypothetical protein